MKTRIVGVAFPLPKHMIERLLNGQKDVFIKYVAQPGSTRLISGHKLFLYASGGEKQLVGETIITKVKFLKPNQIFDMYGERLFLSKTEFVQYAQSQPRKDADKDLLVLEVAKPKKYKRPIRFPQPLTMAGRYVTKEMYLSLKANH